jgi:hypothetical protein
MNHGNTTSAKRNSGRKSTLTEIYRRTLRRIASKNHTTTAAELNIHLEDPVSTKPVRHELHKSNIHGRAATAKPLITGSNVQMRKRWCHDHNTWISDKWKCACDMVRWVVLPAVSYIRKSVCYENLLGNLLSGMLGSNSETWERFCDGLGNNNMVQHSVGPLLPLMAELLQGSTWTGWVIRCIPWSKHYFRITMQFSKSTMPPFTQLKLFNHGLKSMKANFNIFPSQHNHHISTKRQKTRVSMGTEKQDSTHKNRMWEVDWNLISQNRVQYRAFNTVFP